MRFDRHDHARSSPSGRSAFWKHDLGSSAPEFDSDSFGARWPEVVQLPRNLFLGTWSRSYACEGVGTVRKAYYARRLTRLRGATTGQAPNSYGSWVVSGSGWNRRLFMVRDGRTLESSSPHCRSQAEVTSTCALLPSTDECAGIFGSLPAILIMA